MHSLPKKLGILLLSMWLLAGCQTSNKSPAKEASPGPQQKISYTERVKQTLPEQRRDQSSQAIANRLVQIATSIPNVRGATAVVLGKYTIVGIDLDPRLDRGRVGTVKYSVAQALHEDPQGARALVTADVDLVQRLRDINEDIRNGRPVAGILEELADITNRIIPQPSKETKKREEAPSRNNEQRLKQSP
ncbi:YhcN/YlaJ family sporulation lipoprotein [Thermoflavimicrobium dichotomicum]|uniref:Sporulation lipoprotein, YhcN/YlaJ family n=1 Tax=Thermoflavimicrobium dichotomicum TaxID=46223 RepID=A0A1I3N9D9_9BACL|nr:YhcN/YlaJ family sporulation lipoprotein [Thermoflavimicrobium dichotomicum]SFJ05476.1 sporulation lipoprotein, YhcN/YlaJ family [Thermoflavimicrobium dichotomicum]